MLSKKHEHILQIFVLLTVAATFESARLCSSCDGHSNKPIFITFGNGSQKYSKKTACDFNFTTKHEQKMSIDLLSIPGTFLFLNKLERALGWHSIKNDHTVHMTNVKNGYMMLIDGALEGGLIFMTHVNELECDRQYEFSAYITNIMQSNTSIFGKVYIPVIQFSVRSTDKQNNIIAEDTVPIPYSNSIHWKRYGLSFTASNSSVKLQIDLVSGGRLGNDFVIDDIQLCACPHNQSAFNETADPSEMAEPNEDCVTTPSGMVCDRLQNLCYLMEPCFNGANCEGGETGILTSYQCFCLPGFHGKDCDIDRRECKPNTCSHGHCVNASDANTTSFRCMCENGWEGTHCHLLTNYCTNHSCQNNAICQPVLLDYKCLCLSSGYTGRYCENVSREIVILQIVSSSFAYISIISIMAVVVFIITMDVLKYVVGIDPTREDLLRIRQMNRRKHPIIVRPIYIHAPVSSSSG